MLARWWFQWFFYFTPTWGNDPIWRAYFSNGLKPLARFFLGAESRISMNIPQFISTTKACQVTFGGGWRIFPTGRVGLVHEAVCLEYPSYAGLFWDRIPILKRWIPRVTSEIVCAVNCVAYISWSTWINCWLVVKLSSLFLGIFPIEQTQHQSHTPLTEGVCGKLRFDMFFLVYK